MIAYPQPYVQNVAGDVGSGALKRPRGGCDWMTPDASEKIQCMAKKSKDEATDVLAADVFPVGEADVGGPEEAAHDVLAADEFAVPAADPDVHEGHQHEHDHDHAHEHVVAGPIPAKLAGVGAGVLGALLAVFGIRRRRRRRRAKRAETESGD